MARLALITKEGSQDHHQCPPDAKELETVCYAFIEYGWLKRWANGVQDLVTCKKPSEVVTGRSEACGFLNPMCLGENRLRELGFSWGQAFPSTGLSTLPGHSRGPMSFFHHRTQDKWQNTASWARESCFLCVAKEEIYLPSNGHSRERKKWAWTVDSRLLPNSPTGCEWVRRWRQRQRGPFPLLDLSQG